MKRKILFIVPSMRGGGAERVILTLLKHLPRDRFESSLALVEKVGPYLEELPDDITIYDLNARRVRYAVPRMIRLVRRIHPDIVFSTLGPLNIALLSLRKLLPANIRMVVREANTVSSQLQDNVYKLLWFALYRRFYPKADKIICQSKAMEDDIRINFGIVSSKIKVIHNPIDLPRVRGLSSGVSPFRDYGKGPHILAIGRLEKQKAYHRLINSFPNLLRKQSDAQLWILGEGSLKEDLYQRCRQLGIDDMVHFMGFQRNPYVWMSNADLFVLSSVYEGLPNVLLEAMACGCPVISLEHPGGTREILKMTGQVNRYVNDLSWDDDWFDRPSSEIQLIIEKTFGLDAIIGQYTSVLSSV
jgi:glycosyltransferase involved in cell wall biosynthesis